MQILLRDPYYFDIDDDEVFFQELKPALEAAFPGSSLKKTDAGPSADVPALLFEYADSLGLLALSASRTIPERARAWKETFDRVAGFFTSKRLDFSIDEKTALNAATFYALLDSGAAFDTFGLTFAIRHWSNLNGAHYEVLRLDDHWPATTDFSVNTQEVRQMWCRYLVGARLGGAALTIIIEKDGSCPYIKKL